MDRISDSGSDDLGSSPNGITKRGYTKPLFLYLYSSFFFLNSAMSEKFIIYALKSSIDSRIYVGFTRDVEKRLKEHNSGKTKSTKGYRPWSILFTEELNGTREEA
jgi:putative endonuclease